MVGKKNRESLKSFEGSFPEIFKLVHFFGGELRHAYGHWGKICINTCFHQSFYPNPWPTAYKFKTPGHTASFFRNGLFSLHGK